MADTYYVGRRGVRSSEEIIDRKELDRLRMMARRGTDYEAAARSLRGPHLTMIERRAADPADEYARGWLAGMRELAERIVGGMADG